jgi:alpha-galactosidase
MSTGLRALVDDRVCQYMSDNIPEDGVVDVYAENHEQDATIEASDYEEEMEDNSEDDEIEDEDLQPLTVWKSESKEEVETGRGTEANGEENSNTGSDYMLGDSCSSGEAISLDDVIYEGVAYRPQTGQEDEDDGNCTPYVDSSDAESVDEYPRFNKKNHVVNFKLGMKFSSKKQFKKAVIKHGLDKRKVIRFPKDDPKRVRAKYDWKGLPMGMSIVKYF